MLDYAKGEVYRTERDTRVRVEAERDAANRERDRFVAMYEAEKEARATDQQSFVAQLEAQRAAAKEQLISLLDRFAPNPTALAAAAGSLDNGNGMVGLTTKEQLEMVRRAPAVGRQQIADKRAEVERLEALMLRERTGTGVDESELSPGEIARVAEVTTQ